MHSTNPVVLLKPAVVIQLNIFGGADEIPVNPPKASRATPPGPAPLHDAPAPAVKAAKPVNPVPTGLETQPKPTPNAPAKAVGPDRELLVDPDERISVDLEAVEPQRSTHLNAELRHIWENLC